MVRQFLLLTIIVETGWALTSVVTMTHGTLLNWPDYLHVDYGFPLTYATHTLDTLVGPVDRWNVNLGALSVDLSFWLLGMITILVASVYLQSRMKNKGS